MISRARRMTCGHAGNWVQSALWALLHPDERRDLTEVRAVPRLRAAMLARLLLRAGITGRLSAGPGNPLATPFLPEEVVAVARESVRGPTTRYRRPPRDRCPVASEGGRRAAYVSIAHDNEFCLVAWDRSRPIGCDVEKVHLPMPVFCETHFLPGERHWLREGTRLNQDLAAFRATFLWTVKEAYYKLLCARGSWGHGAFVPSALSVRIGSLAYLHDGDGPTFGRCWCGDRELCDLVLWRFGGHLFTILSAKE